MNVHALMYLLHLQARRLRPPFARIEVDEFARQLFTLWDQRASSWEEEARSCIVRVWFVDHGGAQPHGLAPRDVRIYMPVWSWRTHIWQIWADQVIPGVGLDYHLVEPFPPTSDIQVAAHVLLVQRAVPNWLTSIVTCRDFSTEPESFHQFAVTTLNPIPFEVFLQVFGLFELCFGVMPSRDCQVWLRDELLHPGVPVQGIMGLSFEIQVRLRDSEVAPADAVEAPVLLQLSQHLTRGRVTHTDHEVESFELSSLQAGTCFAVRLVGLGALVGQLPTYVTVEGAPTSSSVGEELRAFGIDAHCVVTANGTLAVVFSGPWPLSADQLLLLFTDSSITVPDEDAVFIHQVDMAEYSELDLMVMLYKFGIEKAVIQQTNYCLPGLLEVVFVYSEGKLTATEGIKRPLKPWPPRVPCEQIVGPLWSPQDDDALPKCLLDMDLKKEDLNQLFHSSAGTLCTSLEGLDLPEVTLAAVQSLSQHTQYDRLVIYMDGSSQSRHKHHSPAFNEDFDLPDSWSFVVLGETFINETDSDLSLVGWCAHQVRCDPDHPWFVGATHLGSAVAEREALFWALLWRIGYNSSLPTVFRSDSMLAIGQAAGTLGPATCDLSFKMLRGSAQLLQSAIGAGLQLDHVFGHAGDPWNELVDMLAKHEAKNSFYLKRPDIDIPHLRGKLPFLWMIFDVDHGTPGFAGQGFDAYSPSLPSWTAPLPEPTPSCTSRTFDFGLSIASANVLSMYNSENGFGGKLDYLRTQFIDTKLNLLGIQEARTQEGLSLKHGVLRLCSGSLQGQGGVELWVNLGQPFAHRGKRAILFQKRDFHVAHRDPQRLLVRIQNDQIGFWCIVLHAPHSGSSLMHRSAWWAETQSILQQFVELHEDLVACMDANAAPGQADGRAVLSTGFSVSSGTTLLREFLDQYSLCLPLTGRMHCGTRTTWVSPDDGEYTIDYVAVPCTWLPSCTLSTIVENFDLANVNVDHSVVAVELHWRQNVVTRLGPSPRPKNFDRGKIGTHLEEHLLQSAHCHWNDDVQSHADKITQHFHQALCDHCPVRRQGPKKPYVSEEAWKLRADKLRCRKHLAEGRALLRREALARIFRAWQCPQSCAEALDLSFNYGTSLRTSILKCFVAFSQHVRRLRALLQHSKQAALNEVLQQISPNTPASLIQKMLQPFQRTLQQVATRFVATTFGSQIFW